MADTRGSLVSFFKASSFIGFGILEVANIDCDAAYRTNLFPYYCSYSHLLPRCLFTVVISGMNSTKKSAACILQTCPYLPAWRMKLHTPLGTSGCLRLLIVELRLSMQTLPGIRSFVTLGIMAPRVCEHLNQLAPDCRVMYGPQEKVFVKI